MEYCLDTNVLIQAWNLYYSPLFCSDYWMCLDALIQKGQIYIPEEVFNEVKKKDDDLYRWVYARAENFVRKIDERVEEKIEEIFSDEDNTRLTDNIRGRSLADPWVIAHAMADSSIVVTKEHKETLRQKKVLIPNVCDKMKVPWMNDFQFIREVGIIFSAKIKE